MTFCPLDNLSCWRGIQFIMASLGMLWGLPCPRMYLTLMGLREPGMCTKFEPCLVCTREKALYIQIEVCDLCFCSWKLLAKCGDESFDSCLNLLSLHWNKTKLVIDLFNGRYRVLKYGINALSMLNHQNKHFFQWWQRRVVGWQEVEALRIVTSFFGIQC